MGCEARFRVPKNGTQGDEKGRQRREDGIAAGDQGRDRSATFKCDCEAGRDAFSEPKIEANDFSFSPLRKVGFFKASLAQRYFGVPYAGSNSNSCIPPLLRH